MPLKSRVTAKKKKPATTRVRKKRDYRKEYLQTQGSERVKKDRAARNKARRIAMKKGLVKKGDGRDVDHKDFNPRNNSKSNVRVVKSSVNKSRQPKRTRKK